VLHLDRVGNEGGGIKAEHYLQASAAKPKPVVAALPHTASMVPLVWMAGGCSLLAAWALRVARRKKDASQTI
jgi:enoyl-CoA hydratase/carnithine racemase